MIAQELPVDGTIITYNYKEAVPLIVDMVKTSPCCMSGKGEHVKKWSSVIATFDIETTKLENENWNKKLSEQYHYFEYPFCWQAAVGTLDGREIYIEGSDVSQYFDMLRRVGSKIDCKIIWWIHNLAFEGNNLADYFYTAEEFERGFWKSSTSPLYIEHSHHEFRCSAQLTHKSLAQLGTEIQFEKLKGDFDYSVKRDYEELGYPQSPMEHNYRYRDVEILLKYIRRETTSYCNGNGYPPNPYRLPYTQTGYVRKDLQKHFSKTGTGYYILGSTALTQREYEDIRPGFFGGFVHENFRYVGIPITERFLHVDIVSAYPWALCTKEYLFKVSEALDLDVDLYKKNLYREHYGQIADVMLLDVRLKPGHIPYIPYIEGNSKVGGVNVVEEAGKVIQADGLTITCTDVDMRLILRNYDIGEMQLRKLYVGTKKPLPYAVVDRILYFYEQKTTLKGIHSADGSVEYQYQLYKQMLNSTYGCAAQDRMLGDYHLEGLTPVADEKEYKESDTLPYQWAMYVTAYVREVVYSFISWLTEHATDGEIFYYSDTDSVFCKDTPGAREYIRLYNEERIKDLERLRNRYFNIIPKNKKGVPQYLGCLDLEDDSDGIEFCTIGPKRYYITHPDGTTDITFSGLRATKVWEDEKGERHNGRNTERLIERYGTVSNAFKRIVEGDIVLEYEEGTDKLSNYNTRYDFRNTKTFGREIRRPCSYTLYGMGTQLSLNESLSVFLSSDLYTEVY